MTDYYNVDGEKITQEEGLRLFGIDNDTRQLCKDTQGDVAVSTVCLVIDHAFGHGKPLIYETMIFGGEHDNEQWRYSTRLEAIQGHAEACKLAFG